MSKDDLRRKLEFHLPWPPSVNMYWRRSPRHGLYLSDAAKSFRQSVAAIFLYEKFEPFPASSRLGVKLVLRRKDKHPYDVDNFTKGVFDSLTHAELWSDDGQVDDVRCVRGATCRPIGRVEVSVWELE